MSLEKIKNAIETLDNLKDIIEALKLIDVGKIDEAQKILKSLIEKDPDNALVYYILGRIYKLTGNLDKAIECHEKTMYMIGLCSFSCSNLICSNFIKGNFEKALDYINKLEKHCPQPTCISLFHKAIIYLELLNYEKALEALDELTKINDKFIPPWEIKASVYKNLGKYDEALNCLNKIIEAKPNDLPAWILKAEILERLGKLKEALKAYYVVVELNPKIKWIYRKIGYLELTLGNYEEAIKYLKEYIKEYPNSIRERFYLALAYEKLKNYEKALELYDEVIKRIEEVGDNEVVLTNALLRKARILEVLGRVEEAIEYYNKALS